MEKGNKIVYPMHGAGIISEITKEDFFGEKKTYATVRIGSKDMMIKFQVDRADALHIRPVSKKRVILEELQKPASSKYLETSNWNKRYQATVDKMKIGTPKEMAEVLINLKCQDIKRGLSSGERQLYHHALDIVSSEVMLSENIDFRQAQQLVEETLKEVIPCEDQSS